VNAEAGTRIFSTIFEFDSHSLVRAFHQEPTMSKSQSGASRRSLGKESSVCAIAKPILGESLPDELHYYRLFDFRPEIARW